MKEELADFLRFCAVERRLAPLTCSAYERDVSACLGYLQGQGIVDLAEVRPTHLRAFLAEDARRRPAPSSQARATAALKSFFRFLVDDEQLERDPARPLRTPKKRETLPDVLTMAELERLLAAPARGDIWERHFRGKPERDRLLLALFAYAGLRRSELLGLAWDDVDLARRLLYVRKAKGGRQRVVPIHPALAPLFAAYYATRVPLIEQSLFVGVQETAQLHPARPGLPPLRRLLGRRREETRDAAYAPSRLRLRAPPRRREPAPGAGAARHKHLDSTQRYTRVTAHELRGAVKRLRWVG